MLTPSPSLCLMDQPIGLGPPFGRIGTSHRRAASYLTPWKERMVSSRQGRQRMRARLGNSRTVFDSPARVRGRPRAR
jgi:hypothetical protein